MTGAGPSTVELLLIRSDPPCRKCRRAEVVLQETVALCAPFPVAVRTLSRKDPEAARYGAVLTPMIVLDGKVVCAGIVPRPSGLAKLILSRSG